MDSQDGWYVIQSVLGYMRDASIHEKYMKEEVEIFWLQKRLVRSLKIMFRSYKKAKKQKKYKIVLYTEREMSYNTRGGIKNEIFNRNRENC